MIYCAIDTSTDWCNIGLYKNKSLIKKIEKKEPKKHLEMLPIYFNKLKSQLSDKRIDVLAVSIGHGSFTGLRIGLGFAKGLALGLKIPIIPVPTLQILAFSHKKILFEENFNVCLYSHKKIIYHQIFSSGKPLDKVKAVEWDKIDHKKKGLHYGCDHLIGSQNYTSILPSLDTLVDLANQFKEKWILKDFDFLIPNYVSSFKVN